MTEYNPENYPISESCPVRRIVRPGDELFVFCSSFYVKAKVQDVTYVHNFPDFIGERKNSTWIIWDENPETNRSIDLEALKGTFIYNILPWVDWPIGHAAYIGDDAFFTLDEARRVYGRFSKRKKHRRAKTYLRQTMGFISGTHRMNGHPGPKWPKLETYYRKIYV